MLALVAALAQNDCIGVQGRLPWHLPEDVARFKMLTLGKVVLMGRKTWESLPDRFRPLPGRMNVVVTRQAGYAVLPGVAVYGSIDDALAALAEHDVMVIGGAEIYAQTVARADTLYLTRVYRSVPGDAFFPPFNAEMWTETERDDHDTHTFLTYQRR